MRATRYASSAVSRAARTLGSGATSAWSASPASLSRRAIAFGLVAVVVAGAGAGCSSCQGGKAVAKADLTLVPHEADFVFMANFDRMRDTAMWRKALDLRDSTPEMKQRFDEITQRTGTDPFKNLKSAFIAFPASGNGGEFAAVLRGGPFDELKLAAYAKEQLQKQGNDLAPSDYNGHKLYTDGRGGATFATVFDKSTMFVGGKEWIKKMVDLAGKAEEKDSASSNTALTALIKQTKVADALWGVGMVPDQVRARLKDDPRLSSAGTMKSIHASIDFQAGVTLTAAVDLAGPAEATDLSTKINGQIADAKKNPQMLMLGLAPFLDAAKVQAQGPAFLVDIKLTQQQVDDLIGRLKGLLQSVGGQLQP